MFYIHRVCLRLEGTRQCCGSDPFMFLDPPNPDPSLFCMNPDVFFLSLKSDVNSSSKRIVGILKDTEVKARPVD